MTKKCLICKRCKKEASPNTNCSSHTFPKNEIVKKKWMDAINLPTTPNFKTTYIYSDHFENKSFHYSDEFRSRKRLRAEAIPEINLNPYYLSTENVTKEPVTERVVLVSNINKLENNILKEKNLELNKVDKETEICGEKMPF